MLASRPAILARALNGILAYPSSSHIAEAIECLCENKQLVEEYGRNSQRDVMQYSWENIAQSYFKLYDAVAHKHEVPRVL